MFMNIMNNMQQSIEFDSNATKLFFDNKENLDTSRKKTPRTPRKLMNFSDTDSSNSYYSDSDSDISTNSSDSGSSKKVTGYTFPELDRYNSFINFLTRKRLASNSTGFSSHIAAFVYKLASKRQCLLSRKGKHRYRRKLRKVSF
jgi:hypothetical protein